MVIKRGFLNIDLKSLCLKQSNHFYLKYNLLRFFNSYDFGFMWILLNIEYIESLSFDCVCIGIIFN